MDGSKEPKLLVIVGLPGSGKTMHLHELIKNKVIDNSLDDYEYGPLKRTGPAMRPQDQKLIDGLKQGGRWAIANTRFCDENERTKLIAALTKEIPGLKLEFIYFANEPDACQKNAAIRKGSFPRHEINLISYYTQIYTIPDYAEILPVYTC